MCLYIPETIEVMFIRSNIRAVSSSEAGLYAFNLFAGGKSKNILDFVRP